MSNRSNVDPGSAPAETPRLIPVPRWNEYHDWPPPGGLRHLIFRASSNGFERAFVRVGRRVLVNEGEFFAAVAARNAQGAA